RGGRRANDPAGRSPTIIVADSHDAARNVYSRFLNRFSFRVETAATGPELVDLLRRARPVVVLSEPVLPRVAGDELAAALWAYRERYGVAILVLGGGRPTNPRFSSIVQPTAVLEKPFELAVMLDEVRRAIRICSATRDGGDLRPA